MAPDVLERLRAADPAARIPDPDPDDRERLRRAIVAVPVKLHAHTRRWWRRGRPLAILAAGALLLGSGTVYATRYLAGAEHETSYAALSPSGKPSMLAFTNSDTNCWGWCQILTVSTHGTNLSRLSGQPSWVSPYASQPAWSPDGSKIAYVTDALCVMNADGSGRRELTTAPVGMPAWSPDGKQIVFVDSGGGREDAEVEGQLLIVNADGSGLRAVSEHDGVSGAYPVWAPDGRIYFSSTTEGELPYIGPPAACTASICAVYPDGNGLSVITAVPTVDSFSLSPNGRWLLIWDGRSDRFIRLLASGQGLEVAVVDNLSRLLPARYRSPATRCLVDSSWSPDGRWIAFSLASNGRRKELGWWSGLFVVKADGSELRRVLSPGKMAAALKNNAHYNLVLDLAWQPR